MQSLSKPLWLNLKNLINLKQAVELDLQSKAENTNQEVKDHHHKT
jgi:hypothetical protein